MAIVTEICRECGAEAYIDAVSYLLKRPVLCYLHGLDPETRARWGYPVYRQQPPKGGPK